MRLLPLILLVICCSASAEWTKVGESTNALMYVDLETMEKKQGTVFIWLLTNVFDEQPFKSIASRMEYDCKQKRGKVHQEYRYSEHFMGGTNVSPNPGVAGEWYYAAPGTVAMNIINTLCKK